MCDTPTLAEIMLPLYVSDPSAVSAMLPNCELDTVRSAPLVRTIRGAERERKEEGEEIGEREEEVEAWTWRRVSE